METEFVTHLCCCSVAQSRPTLCDPMDCSTPGFPVAHQLLELAQTQSNELVMPSSHLILCRPLLLLPSILPSIRVSSNELALHIRWPKYWRLSFTISPSCEYSGLISIREMKWNWRELFTNPTVTCFARRLPQGTGQLCHQFSWSPRCRPWAVPSLDSVSTTKQLQRWAKRLQWLAQPGQPLSLWGQPCSKNSAHQLLT